MKVELYFPSGGFLRETLGEAGIDRNLVQQRPEVKVICDPHERLCKEGYLVLIFDPDAPRGYLHWLASCSDACCKELVPYRPPNPPDDGKTHRYQVLISPQPAGFQNLAESLEKTRRSPMNLENFLVKNQLFPSGGFQFTLEPAKEASQRGNTKPGKGYFNPLGLEKFDETHQKYCRCTLHVAAKNPRWCNEEQAWFASREGKTCYNPYAVCTSSVGRGNQDTCLEGFELSQLPEEELRALYDLKRSKLPPALKGEVQGYPTRSQMETRLQKFIS